jgi:hypothetical protein
MDHSAAPIFDTLVDYHAHGRYRFAPPDTARAAIRTREPARRSARMRSTKDRAVDGSRYEVDGFCYEEADLAVGGDRGRG